MNSTDLLARYSSTGWDSEALLDLCLEYIGNQDQDDAFLDFLAEQAALEQAMSEEDDDAPA